MTNAKPNRHIKNLLICFVTLSCAVLLSLLLSGINDDNNPFATPVFILAITLIARLTDGYIYGIAAALVGTFCVNYIFTFPFWQFDLTLTGYPLTFAMMLVVSLVISALTTQVKKQEQLRFDAEREKMHANLLRAVAHDIRTPLASILGSSSVLLDQELNAEDRSTLVSEIHKDAQWLVRVTENLLSVTRFSGGAVRLKKTEEVLEEIIGSAINKYRRTPDALPVRVEHPESILLVPMDAMLIEQVLINLFDNVSAHAVSATQIWLHVFPRPDRVILSVEDDGEGIPSERLDTLFEGSANRITQTRPDSRRNMGIGLSVCRSIIRAHGGEMSVGKSRHGGAMLTLYLPCPEENYG